jgi:hypothetical protein
LGNNEQRTLIELIFENYNFKIQIHVFYKRNNFLYIGDLPKDKTTTEWFNDVPRAIQKYYD